MSLSPDDLPIGDAYRHYIATRNMLDRRDAAHLANHHRPWPDPIGEITEIPHAHATIPQVDLAAIAEMADNNPDMSLAAIASYYGYPPLLVERVLPEYIAVYRRRCRERARALGVL